MCQTPKNNRNPTGSMLTCKPLATSEDFFLSPPRMFLSVSTLFCFWPLCLNSRVPETTAMWLSATESLQHRAVELTSHIYNPSLSIRSAHGKTLFIQAVAQITQWRFSSSCTFVEKSLLISSGLIHLTIDRGNENVSQVFSPPSQLHYQVCLSNDHLWSEMRSFEEQVES